MSSAEFRNNNNNKYNLTIILKSTYLVLQPEKVLNERLAFKAERRVGKFSICQMGGEVLFLEELGQDFQKGVLALQ